LAEPLLLSVVALDASGGGRLPLPIPNDPALKGALFVNQWWVLDLPANALGFVFSEGGLSLVR
jgi:hypothetical protein